MNDSVLSTSIGRAAQCLPYGTGLFCDSAGLSFYDFNVTESVLWVGQGATVLLEDFLFARNLVGHENNMGSITDALITVVARDPDFYKEHRHILPALEQSTILQMKKGSFEDNIAPYMLLSWSTGWHTEGDAQIFSDAERAVHYSAPDSLLTTTLPLAEVPSDREGINVSSPWLTAVQEVRRLKYIPYMSLSWPCTIVMLCIDG